MKSKNEFSFSNLETRVIKEVRKCLAEEKKETLSNGLRFITYFLRNSTSCGVLVKNTKEVEKDLNLSTYRLTKILKILECHQVIYRRKGIIGLWRT